MEVKHSFLVETCLLTHGLRSIADDEILSAWPDGLSCITWVDEGSIRIGSAAEYILFRRRCRELGFGRIDSEGLEEALSSGGSGALTASGTMAVCERLGVPLAVTCGMGGICDIKGEELCPDLPALRDIPVSLIATAPKDMLDIEATLRWLANNGVRTTAAAPGISSTAPTCPFRACWTADCQAPAAGCSYLTAYPQASAYRTPL